MATERLPNPQQILAVRQKERKTERLLMPWSWKIRQEQRAGGAMSRESQNSMVAAVVAASSVVAVGHHRLERFPHHRHQFTVTSGTHTTEWDCGFRSYMSSHLISWNSKHGRLDGYVVNWTLRMTSWHLKSCFQAPFMKHVATRAKLRINSSSMAACTS